MSQLFPRFASVPTVLPCAGGAPQRPLCNPISAVYCSLPCDRDAPVSAVLYIPMFTVYHCARDVPLCSQCVCHVFPVQPHVRCAMCPRCAPVSVMCLVSVACPYVMGVSSVSTVCLLYPECALTVRDVFLSSQPPVSSLPVLPCRLFPPRS